MPDSIVFGARGAWLTCLLLSGCVFSDAAPADANIQCAVNEQCPSGWRCATRLGRCVQRSDLDAVGPTLTGAVAPSLTRPGTDVVVSLAADEPLLGAPEVEARVGTSVRRLAQRSDTTWVLALPGTEPDGLISFFASAEDAAGNGTRGVALGATRVDGTPPVVVSTRVSPETVTPSSPVSVVVGLSEDVRAGARLLVRSLQGQELARLESTEDTSTLRFEVSPPAGVGDGVLVLELEGLLDLAGNAMAAAELGRVTVDGTAPEVGPLGLAGRRFSAEAGFNVVVVPVAVTGATRVQACLGSECRDASGVSNVSFPITAGGTAGPRLVRLRASDLAGNTTEVAESIEVDFAAPQLAEVQLEPATIAPGGQVVVSATFDEPLSAGATLVVEQDDGGWTDRLVTSRGGLRLVSFVVRMPPASLPSARFLLTLDGLADDVANARAPLDAGFFMLDADPPTFLAPDAGYPRRYSHQPGYDLVTLPTLPVSGAARVETCLDSACVEADGGWASFPVLASASEGGHAVTWRAFDAVGNAAVFFDTVVFDYTGPRVLSAGVAYAPPAGCPFSTVSALHQLGSATLSFTTDERAVVTPELDAGAPLSFSSIGATDGGQAFAFAVSARPGLTTGPLALSGWFLDDVGNAGWAPVSRLDADTTPPPDLLAAQEDGFVYTRIPFGAQRTAYQPHFTVSADAGTFAPGAFVQVWSADSTTAGLLLASVTADATGALPLSVLPPSDLTRVYFKQFDGACNAQPSAQLATAVPRTNAVLTLGSKIPGEVVPNPNRFVEEYGASSLEFGAFSREWGATELGRVDSVRARTRSPMLHWQVPSPTRGTSTCAAYHPARGETVMTTGNRAYRLGPGGWIEDEVLALESTGTCATFGTGAQGGVMVRAQDAYLSWASDRIETISIFYANENGYVVAGPTGGFISVDVQGSFAVYRGDIVYSWTEVTVENSPPSITVDASNFSTLGGRPVLFDSSSGWMLTDGTAPGTMRWESLPPPPTAPEAVTSLGSAGLLLVGSAQQAAIYQEATGAWQAAPSHPLQSRVVSAWVDGDGFPSILGEDWSVAHFNGTAWSTVLSAAPVTDGYRAAGHSPQFGTLATQASPPRVVFHGAFPDGGSVATWSWDGAQWTQLAGTSPASPTGVAVTEPDGGVMLVGLERGTTIMSTYRFRNDAWQKVTGSGPSQRTKHAMALTRSAEVLLVGGLAQSTGLPLAQSMVWSGASWSGIFPAVTARARAAMGFDPVRRATVVFGGEDPSFLGDTWEYASSWSAPVVSPSPPSRSGASLVWNPVTESLVLVGGATQRDTWFYDGAWRDRTAFSGKPPAQAIAAWDPTRNAVMAVGPGGEAFLAPYLPVAMRFRPSLAGVPRSAVLGGSMSTVMAPGAPAGLRYHAYLPTGWTSIGSATPPDISTPGTSVVLTQQEAQQALVYGLRVVPDSLAAMSLQVDYAELTLSYR